MSSSACKIGRSVLDASELSNSRKVPAPFGLRRIDRDMHRAHAAASLALGQQIGTGRLRRPRRARRSAGSLRRMARRDGAVGEQFVGGEQPSFAVDQRREHARSRKRSPVASRNPLDRERQEDRRPALGKRHSSISLRKPARSTSIAGVPASVATPATQPAPSRQAIETAVSNDLARTRRPPKLQRRGPSRSACDRPRSRPASAPSVDVIAAGSSDKASAAPTSA